MMILNWREPTEGHKDEKARWTTLWRLHTGKLTSQVAASDGDGLHF